MKYLKKISFVILLAITSIGYAQDDAPFQKSDNVGLLPGLKKGFKPQISIAPQVAFIDFVDSNLNSSGVAFGAELALQCPLACPKKNYIRQQISFLLYSDDEFSHWEATINPEYRFLVKPNFELAAGPSLGLANNAIENTNFDTTKFTYGLTTSATFHFNKMFVGVSGRYMAQSKEEIGSIDYSFNNIQALVKLGLKL